MVAKSRHLIQQALQATSAPCTCYLLASLNHHIPSCYLRKPPKEVSHRKEADLEERVKVAMAPLGTNGESLGTTVPPDGLEEGKTAEVLKDVGPGKRELMWTLCWECFSLFHF